MHNEFIAQQSNCCEPSVKPVQADRYVLIYMGHDSILVLLDMVHLVNMIDVLFRHILELKIVEMVDNYRIKKRSPIKQC